MRGLSWLGFPVGHDLTEAVRTAILRMPESASMPAVEPSGQDRNGARVCEPRLALAAAGWPEKTRLICRRERLHPGAR
jgi:hypothetical protein